jgi:hypothetical protein
LSEFSKSSTRAKFGEEFRERTTEESKQQASAAGSVEISPKRENKIQKFENEVNLQGFNRQK